MMNWIQRGGATTIVLTLAAGFFIERFFNHGTGFVWPAFIAGCVLLWVVAAWSNRRHREPKTNWMYDEDHQ